jgi:CRISPR-associated protein Cmr5
MSRQRSLEQDRAKAAWQTVKEAKGRAYAGKYGQLARSAPADIQANGLGQTLAFWNAKGEEHHRAILKDVSQWVKDRIKFPDDNLLKWIISTADTDGYRRATVEAIAFSIWLKRFAEAELPRVEGG